MIYSSGIAGGFRGQGAKGSRDATCSRRSPSPRASSCSRLGAIETARGCDRRNRNREAELKRGAARIVAPRPDSPFVGLDDRPADRQAYPHSTLLGRVERLKNAIDGRWIDAGARIGHRDENIPSVVLEGLDPQVSRFIVADRLD